MKDLHIAAIASHDLQHSAAPAALAAIQGSKRGFEPPSSDLVGLLVASAGLQRGLLQFSKTVIVVLAGGHIALFGIFGLLLG